MWQLIAGIGERKNYNSVNWVVEIGERKQIGNCGNGIATIQLFYFSLLSPPISISISQLGSGAWAQKLGSRYFKNGIVEIMFYLSSLCSHHFSLFSLTFSHNFNNAIAEIHLFSSSSIIFNNKYITNKFTFRQYLSKRLFI